MPSVQPKEFTSTSFDEALATIRGAKGEDWQKFLGAPTPQEVHEIYNRGFRGIRPETSTPEERREFGEMIAAQPGLYEIFPWAKGIGKGKINCPYVAAMKLIEGWGGLNAQVQGDCTVHGTQHACEVDYCIDCLFGETKFMGQIAFENIYRSRGFNGDGWSCYAPTKYVGPEGNGGMLYRAVYEGPGGEKVDLTKYNSSWQSNGRAGVPGWLEEISRKNKAKWIPQIRTLEELRDAHAMGFGSNVCSGQGFASSTDENGVAVARGGWSHAMCSPASIDNDWSSSKYGGILPMIQNSWGNWNSRSGKPEGAPEMPTGSFYAKGSTVSRMVGGGDTYAIVSVWGWDRTNWEAFIGDKITNHLRSSTVQDYYKSRQEWIAERVQEAVDTNMFLGV